MEENEIIDNNRNCNCTMNISNMNCNCSCQRNMTREEMIEQIRCYDFAINDLALYLDTHPNDQRAICMHRNYCKILKDLKDSYQRVYGPLSIYYPCNKWRWLEEPWPWERGNF